MSLPVGATVAPRALGQLIKLVAALLALCFRVHKSWAHPRVSGRGGLCYLNCPHIVVFLLRITSWLPECPLT